MSKREAGHRPERNMTAPSAALLTARHAAAQAGQTEPGPFDGPFDGPEDCLRHAARAAAAFGPWRDLPPERRAAHLRALADCLEDDADALVACMVAEIGTPVAWARFNVDFAARTLRETAALAPLLADEPLPAGPGRAGRVSRLGCGVVLAIAPWNAPVILGVRAVAAPLLCGNAVLLKGSELAPRSFRMIGALMARAGLPADLARVFVTRPEDSEPIVARLIADPVVRRVNFTGSTRVGRRIAELCAPHLKRPLLELGGQATAIVLPGADPDRAAEALARGAWTNQGQVCMSTERVICVGATAEALLPRLEAARARLRMGDPADETTDIGPVVTEAAAARLAALIADAQARGARLVGGGTVAGRMVAPTLLDGVARGMRLHDEEAFGPVLSVIRAGSEAEALTIANDGAYGLAAAVFARDPDRAEAFARDLECGICHIDAPTLGDDPAAPFGGLKDSGFGRFGGRWALDEFTETRWTTRPVAPRAHHHPEGGDPR